MDSKLVNVVEYAVWELMERMLAERDDVCKCDKCKQDIAAFALNQLKPRYVASKKGEAIARADSLDQKCFIQVMVALAKAIELVGSNPRHIEGLK